jgi:hypothetical protein
MHFNASFSLRFRLAPAPRPRKVIMTRKYEARMIERGFCPPQATELEIQW